MAYVSPISVYSSKGINDIFSVKSKFGSWVKIWQSQVGVLVDMGVAPRVALDELLAVSVDDLLVTKFNEYERVTHHDINAGIKYLTELCPSAGSFIHAGMTSMDVDDNGRIIQYVAGLDYLADRLNGLGVSFSPFLLKGKRVSGAIGHSQDLINYFKSADLACEFSDRLMSKLGLSFFERTTQIYPREQDLFLADYLISVARTFLNLSNDSNIRSFYDLMISRRSALYQNAAYDLDHRTIADSVVRRVEIPELFLLLDGIINFYDAEGFVSSDWVNPLSRYAKGVASVLSNDDYISDSLSVLKGGLVNSISLLSGQVEKFMNTVYIARTHGQLAELTTVGRWLGLSLDKLVGYVNLIDEGLDVLGVAGLISGLGSSFSYFANTLVFKQSQRQLFEPFKVTQVGSSAMPFKKNPNKAERIIGLSRMIPGRVDSVFRNNAFLGVDLIELLLIGDSLIESFNYLLSAHGGLVFNESAVNQEINEYLFNLVSLKLLPVALEHGAVREVAHNALRDVMLSDEGVNGILENSYFNDLFGDNLSSVVNDLLTLNPKSEIGTSVIDAQASIDNARPILSKYSSLIGKGSSLNV